MSLLKDKRSLRRAISLLTLGKPVKRNSNKSKHPSPPPPLGNKKLQRPIRSARLAIAPGCFLSGIWLHENLLYEYRELKCYGVALVGVVGGAGPRLRAAPANGGAPHAPGVVGPTHLGGSHHGWRWRRSGAADEIRQRCRGGGWRERV